MRKSDIVLAVAVLSVLAGLLTVGYAQNRSGQPDAFELRRQLIDRIEDAFTQGDTVHLKNLAAADYTYTTLRRIQSTEDMEERRRLAQPLLAHILNTRPSSHVDENGLARVEQPFADVLTFLLGLLGLGGCGSATEAYADIYCWAPYRECMHHVDTLRDLEEQGLGDGGSYSSCETSKNSCLSDATDFFIDCTGKLGNIQ